MFVEVSTATSCGELPLGRDLVAIISLLAESITTSEFVLVVIYTIPVTGFTATSFGDGIETVVEEDLALVEVDVLDEVEVADLVELLDELEVEVAKLTEDDVGDTEMEELVVTASEDVSLVVN